MNPWVALIIGLLIGWLIEWVIDWLYWRRRGQTANSSVDYKGRGGKLEFENASLRAEKLRLENLLSTRDAQIAERNSRLASLQSSGLRGAEAANPVPEGVQPMTPGMAPPLRAAQIPNVEKPPVGLGDVGAAEMNAPVVKPPEPAAEVKTPEPVVEAPPVPHDDLTRVSGLNTEMAAWLHQSGIHTYAELGALRPAVLRAILNENSFHTGADAEVVKSARLLSGSLKQVDDLELIDGIGPVIAKVLYNEGIFSFADVAKLNAEQLREIVGERIQRLADEEKILTHARQLAGRE